MMEDKDGMMIMEATAKRKRDELAQGQRKRLKEGDIHPEKREHSPRLSWRTQN